MVIGTKLLKQLLCRLRNKTHFLLVMCPKSWAFIHIVDYYSLSPVTLLSHLSTSNDFCRYRSHSFLVIGPKYFCWLSWLLQEEDTLSFVDYYNNWSASYAGIEITIPIAAIKVTIFWFLAQSRSINNGADFDLSCILKSTTHLPLLIYSDTYPPFMVFAIVEFTMPIARIEITFSWLLVQSLNQQLCWLQE